jgi:hypothetical protein
VNIELYQAIVPHFQQKGLARLLVRDIDAFHDFVDFEWLLAERVQDILSLIQHDETPTAADERAHEPSCRSATFRRKDRGPNPRWARALAETTQSPNRSPLERGTEIFDAETNSQMRLSARQRPLAETHAGAKSPHSSAINANWPMKVSTQAHQGSNLGPDD